MKNSLSSFFICPKLKITNIPVWGAGKNKLYSKHMKTNLETKKRNGRKRPIAPSCLPILDLAFIFVGFFVYYFV